MNRTFFKKVVTPGIFEKEFYLMVIFISSIMLCLKYISYRKLYFTLFDRSVSKC